MDSNCFHCGLDVPKDSDFSATILAQPRIFCCAGCLAIAETLEQNNLTEFYRFRQKPSSKPEELIPQELLELEALDTPDILDEISTQSDHVRSIELGIEGITCAACGWLIEKQLSLIPQVKKISVNVSTHRAQLTWDDSVSLSKLLKELHSLGYRAYPFSEDAREDSYNKVNKNYIKRLLVAALGMMQVMTYALAIYIGEFKDISAEHQAFFHWISGIIATPVVFYSAKPFFQSAYRNLKVRQLGMNLPVSIAILVAYFASVYSLITGGNVYYFDSVVMFTFFLLIGRFLEHRARFQALLKQQNFQQLLPLSVSKRNSDHSLTTLSVSQIKPGDILVINAGSIVPVDGILLENPAELNEAILTGEFMPVKKEIGDSLTSGSTNNSSSLAMQVSHDIKNSHIQKLITLQQSAEQMKPDSVSLADKIAHWYVFGLLILVFLSTLYWWNVEPELAFPIALSVLVVSCPCALSLATPAVIAAATAQLSDLGIMIRSKSALSRFSKIDHVYFDKTGTLTNGVMKLTDIETLSSLTEQECFEVACQLENISNHPISQVFKSQNKLSHEVKNLKETIGKGVSGTINRRNFKLGNREFSLNNENKSSEKRLTSKTTESNDFETLLYLVSDKEHIATFTLKDELKPTSFECINQLNQNQFPVTLLSGDSKNSVKNTAKQLNIPDYISGATPEQKLEIINLSQQNGEHSLMVGDGFNDVGALSAANVSITMSNATNLSKTASDAVLVSSDLTVIAKTLTIAKKVNRIIKQNLFWAVLYNVTAIPFAMMGLVPAWLAAIGMSLSSLVVVLNALRLRK